MSEEDVRTTAAAWALYTFERTHEMPEWDGETRDFWMDAARVALAAVDALETSPRAVDEWIAEGVHNGYVMRSGHVGWDGCTQVPTLVVQTDAVKDLHERGALGSQFPAEVVESSPLTPKDANERTPAR